MNEQAAALIRSGSASKGDVLGIARLAAIQATKRTDELIPLCHSLPLENVQVEFGWISDSRLMATNQRTESETKAPAVTLQCTVVASTTGKTGVEMEALMGVSVACLTIYDMLKSTDRRMSIDNICLQHKSGGASGEFTRELDVQD